MVLSSGVLVYLLCRRMNSAEGNDNDLMLAQEKLEWVTPKISLMGCGVTEGKAYRYSKELPLTLNGVGFCGSPLALCGAS